MPSFEEIRTRYRDAMLALASFIRTDRVLGARLADGRATFFGSSEPRTGQGELFNAAAQRFMEWFALERRAGGSPPIHAFLSSGCPGLEEASHPYARALSDSFAGVFLVKDFDDTGLELEDAVDGRTLGLLLPRSARQARRGDTLIGRLVQVPGDDRYFATESTEFFHGTSLFTAVSEEAELARLEGVGERSLSQLEVEKLVGLSATEDPANVERIEAELARFLARTSDHGSVSEISYALSVSSRPGPVMGPFLEEIAFRTDLDLVEASRLCLQLWNAHQLRSLARDEPEQPAREALNGPVARSPGEASDVTSNDTQIDGKTILEEFEQGLARHEDIESLFERLEGMLGTAPEADESGWQTEDEGNVRALLAEYLWECERLGRPVAGRSAAMLERFVGSLDAQGIREIERIEEGHLARVLLTPWAEGKEGECFELVDALESWTGWIRETQMLEGRFEVATFRDTLRREQARVSSLRERLDAGAWAGGKARTEKAPSSAERAEPWQVARGGKREGWRLESPSAQMELPCGLELRIGDLILGSPEQGRFQSGYRFIPWVLAKHGSE